MLHFTLSCLLNVQYNYKRKPFASVAVGIHFVSQSAVSLAAVGAFKSTSAV